MAFNKAGFKTRASSAVVFALVMLAGLLIHPLTFYVLFTFIHCGTWIEFQRLTGKIEPAYLYPDRMLRFLPVLFGCGFLFFCINPDANVAGEYFSVRHFGIGIMIVSLLLWLYYFLRQKHYRHIIAKYTLLGLLYITFTIGLLFVIRSAFPAEGRLFEIDFGLKIILTLLVSIWINDTMQYIVGSLIGKTPFSKISPNKTWEGTIGGILLCIVAISAIGHAIDFLPLSLLIAISSVAAVFGTLGDLLESKIKRMAHVKDSGNILPGHGGLLDRFDSFIFSIPFVWIVLLLWLQMHGQLS